LLLLYLTIKNKSVKMYEVKSNKQYHPQMHSAEHILNQTMVRMFNCGRSFSNHIEKKKSKCDYHFERDLTGAELEEIESRVNEVIQSDLKVVEEFISKDDAEKEYNLTKLPEEAGDTIRIIKIGDYDTCPCSGLHVSYTKEIGRFKINSTGYDDGKLRIRFKLFDD
jgi:Ser-tRNA(Ala) deacylase AlaX